MAPRKGSIVKSRRVGTRTQFTGKILERFVSTYNKHVFFHVLDDKGVVWHREPEDLKAIPRR